MQNPSYPVQTQPPPPGYAYQQPINGPMMQPQNYGPPPIPPPQPSYDPNLPPGQSPYMQNYGGPTTPVIQQGPGVYNQAYQPINQQQPLQQQHVVTTQPQQTAGNTNNSDNKKACCAGLCAGLACCALMECDDCDMGGCEFDD